MDFQQKLLLMSIAPMEHLGECLSAMVRVLQLCSGWQTLGLE